ncbi:vacuolar protein sorting-associated protein 18, putative [Plasmodium yoelii]|uniref:Vacuolar protein sorting-associated protein 18 n=2 Tax=Plasmodium yoelii TaxID=5861 RepID=A0AAE9WYM6_PLAYO|nr:vacuolar protein sorting-associated protein 18, putative [Plasmodium yoelii]WBY60654.1 vacuolar protein sorting-associated protein 18 [Plasmodium yoelii yoelii]CDU20453.1 vacuolar protein sorting-associated protein 18, putative [Plasmodium yoelii]VTZ81413.1 vacuolar protein sorting-associated protein 18, putative [Plasmodium yoelii]|eukprot:XP_022812829.1 vacuolar protein sorting-associated protein 18, putative [Plasmodium yoelii]
MNKQDKQFVLKLFKIKNGDINLLKNRITHFSINNKCIHIVFCNNTLIKYYVEENELSYIDFYSKKTSNNKAEIRSIFFDNNCYHGFICLANKEYVYIHFENNIVQNLSKLKKYNISSLCFNDYSDIKNANSFLIATKDGEIIEMSINNKTKNYKDHQVIYSNNKLVILDINMIDINLHNSKNNNELLRIIYFTTCNSLHEISYTIKNCKNNNNDNNNNSEKLETNTNNIKTPIKNITSNNLVDETKVYECSVDSLISILKIEKIRNKNYLFWVNGSCVFISKINNYKKKKNVKYNIKHNKHIKNKTATDFYDTDNSISHSTVSSGSDGDINIVSLTEDSENDQIIKKGGKKTQEIIQNKKKIQRNNYHDHKYTQFGNINEDSEDIDDYTHDDDCSNITENILNLKFYLNNNYVIVNFLDIGIYTNENLKSFAFVKSFYESIYNSKPNRICYNSNENSKDNEKDDINENGKDEENNEPNTSNNEFANNYSNYNNNISVIVDMCVNDLYIFILLEEKLIIINNVNFKKVYEQILSTETYGHAIKIMKDKLDNQIWICTSKHIFKILINKNKNDMFYLKKKKYIQKMFETNNHNDQIKMKKYLIRNNKYDIDQYKYTNISTEDMLISFLHKKQYFVIANFLYNNIHCYNNIIRVSLFIWLIHLYVYSIYLYYYLYRTVSITYSAKKSIQSIENGTNPDEDDISEEYTSDTYEKHNNELTNSIQLSSTEEEGWTTWLEEWASDSENLLSDDTNTSNSTIKKLAKINNNKRCDIENDNYEKKNSKIEHDQINNKQNQLPQSSIGNISDDIVESKNKANALSYIKEVDKTVNKSNATKQIDALREKSHIYKNNKNSFLLFFETLVNKEERQENKYNFDISIVKKVNIKSLTKSENFYIFLKLYKMKNVEIFNFLKCQKSLLVSDIERYKKRYTLLNNKNKNDTSHHKDHVKIKQKLYKSIYSYKCLEVCIYLIILLKHFKSFYQLNEVILEIFQNFNCINFLLLYKYICNDYTYIVNYYINNNKFNLLLNIITIFPQNFLLEVLQEHSFILYLHAPQKYVELLIFYDNLIEDYTNIIICMFIVTYFFKKKKKNENITQGKEIINEINDNAENSPKDITSNSGLANQMHHNHIQDIYDKRTNECIKYLEHISNKLIEESAEEKKENYIYTFECIWKNNHIINCLLILYIENDKDEQIKDLLDRLKNSAIHFDYLFIIRFLKEKKKDNFIPHIYILMKYFEEAVDKSLELNDYDAAKNAVLICEDEEEKKKLFLKIIKHISKNLNNENLKEIINLIRDSHSILNLHDILPYINENTFIECLKTDICSLLDVYNIKIKAKKEEIKDNLRTINLLNNDIKDIKKKHVILNKHDICYICKKNIYYKKFYVFSCNHYFHSACSLNLYINHKSKENLFHFYSILTNYKNAIASQNEHDILLYETKINEILTEECFICGSFSINSITKSFISQSEYDLADSWAISNE